MKKGNYRVEPFSIHSAHLDREVFLEAYLPTHYKGAASLLLINDGQDLPAMPFAPMLDDLYFEGTIKPLVAIGIYCNHDRKLEYGTADVPDYLNRGNRARQHRAFVLKELVNHKDKFAVMY